MKKLYIKDLFNISKGKKETKSFDNKNGIIRYIQIKDLRDNSNIEYCKFNEKSVLANQSDIIIAWDGANAGIVGFNLKGAIGSTLGVLKLNEIKRKKEINPHYIAIFLQGKEKYLRENTTGATIPHVSRKVLENIKIPLPNKTYQDKVVNILHQTQTLIDNRQQQIEALSSLKQSVFLDMFGDPNNPGNSFSKQKIGDLLDVQTGITPSRKNESYWKDGNIPWIKTTEVKNKLINHAEEFVTKKALKETNLKTFPQETILIAMYGQGKTRGQSGVLAFPSSTNQACAALIPNKSMNTIFVWHQLMIQYETLRNLGRGGNQPNLNLSIIKDFEILVPSIDLQEEFEYKINEIESVNVNLQHSLALLYDNYNSLMQKAFNGELFNN